MCGIWGYIGDKPDLEYLREVAFRASRRGPHAWGVAWVNDTGLHTHHELGPFLRAQWSFEPLTNARAVIGHARLATSGSGRSLADTQPVRVGRVAVAHNGNVYHHRAIARAAGHVLATDCDSELIGPFLGGAVTIDGMQRAMGLLGSTPYALLVLDAGGAVGIGRKGQPLFQAIRPEGRYFGQVHFDGAELLPDGEAYVIDSTDATVTRPPKHPLTDVRWIDPKLLHSNDYNPNRVFPPEMRLLKQSILEDGWTQPVVANAETMEIIDGFHRWTLASKDPDIQRVSDGLVPVVFVIPRDRGAQQMATIRHNRARGAHGIVAMGKIVRELRESGLPDEEIRTRLGMEQEEIERLADFTPSPDRVGQESFGKGWVPKH